MRTLIILVAGAALAALCLFISRIVTGTTTLGFKIFVVLWFVAAAVNMWVGVRHAGYSFVEELPIFLLIFGLPALLAYLVTLKFR